MSYYLLAFINPVILNYWNSWRSTITGLDRWTGLVDWTSGLIEIVCKPLPCMNIDSVG